MSNKIIALILLIVFIAILIALCRSPRVRKGFKIAGAILFGILILMMGAALFSPNKATSPNLDPHLRNGEVISIAEDNGAVTIKAMMPVWTEETAHYVIDQSFENVGRLIREDGYDNYSEINYEGYVQMSNPQNAWDEKVIVFTLDKDTITGIKNGNIDDFYIRNFAKDYWISDLISLESSDVDKALETTSVPEATSAPVQTTTPKQVPTEKPAKSNSSATTSQSNALEKAESYLSFSAFSYSGLVSQLEYEGFSTEDAQYAADNCGADWDDQALKKAKSYLDFSEFSYSGLINQLQYDGFTEDQAKYAVDNCGADWNEQAAKKAASYLSFSSFSHQSLVDQLTYDGFTQDQAEYGVSANGL